MTLACLSACSWFGSRKQELPDPTEIIVTGAPAGSLIFVDGLQAGQETAVSDHPQVLIVAAGVPKVGKNTWGKGGYSEGTSVGLRQHTVVTGLSAVTLV